MTWSKFTLLAVGGAVVAGSSLLVWTLAAKPREDMPSWRAALANMPRIEAIPGSRFSAEYSTTRVRLWNDILHEDQWDEPRVRELDAMARGHTFDSTPADDAPEAEIESWLISINALQVIEARLNALAPIEPAARRALCEIVLDSSRSLSRSRRHHACASLAGSGLFGEEICHTRLMELTRDPDTWVADNARRHLAWAQARGKPRAEDQQ